MLKFQILTSISFSIDVDQKSVIQHRYLCVAKFPHEYQGEFLKKTSFERNFHLNRSKLKHRNRISDRIYLVGENRAV
jgi:hypothetical protein